MISEQPFLPLFFNPEDGKLWEQLQKLPPEKRVETVKQALHEFFQTHSEFQSENMTFPEHASSELSLNESAMPNPLFPELRLHTEADGGEESKATDSGEASNDEEIQLSGALSDNELSLESLFEASTQETKPDPLKYLLSVIGEEDDEEVLRLLSSSQKCNIGNEIEAEIGESALPIEQDEELLRKETEKTIVPNSGLSFLLHHVIGEEEDEDVLQFFRRLT